MVVDADVVFPKHENRATLAQSLRARAALPAGLDGGFARRIGAKICSRTKFPFFSLQAFDFPQNGQENIWKYLEKAAANLEKFGVDLEKLAGPEVRQKKRPRFRQRVPHPLGRASGSNGNHVTRFALDRSAIPRLADGPRCFISRRPGGHAPRPIRTAGVLRACRLAFPSSSSRPDAARGSARRRRSNTCLARASR
jgi:ribosomal protein L22